MPVASDTITIAEGDSVGYIPLSITDDTIPELTETFIVYLRSVELTSGASQDSTEAPYLGSPDTTWVSIVTNDDPFGRFYISVTTNTGSVSSVSVPETENFAVSLTVERRGGSMGTVEVALSTAGSTATAGVDYTSLGNLLTFAAGELSKSLVLEILPDNDPERDETILLTLVNATMGSNVAEGEERRVRIVIEANDNAAGIVRVAAESRAAVVQEGWCLFMRACTIPECLCVNVLYMCVHVRMDITVCWCLCVLYIHLFMVCLDCMCRCTHV